MFNPPCEFIKSKHSDIVATARSKPLPVPIAFIMSDKMKSRPRTTPPARKKIRKNKKQLKKSRQKLKKERTIKKNQTKEEKIK